MGMDPLTIGLGLTAASGIYGAIKGDKTNKRNLEAQQGRQGQIDSLAMPYLQQGQNPFAQLLLQSVGAGGGTQGMNTGQDGFMQFLRRGGQSFDNSAQFEALGQVDNRNIAEQVARLHASAGSLGQRFGTAMNSNETLLRRQSLQDINARNAGIASSSFENAANRGLQAQQILASILGQAGGLQQGQQSANAQLLAIMAGQGVPQQQPSQIPGAIGDVGQLAMFLPFLQSAMRTKAPVSAPAVPSTFNPTTFRAPMPSWY